MADDDGLDALLDDALDTYDQTQKEEEEREQRREEERKQREAQEEAKRAAVAGQGAGAGDDAALQILESVLGSLNQGADGGELGEEEQKLQQLVQQGIRLMKDEGGEGDEQQLLQNCLGLLDSISKEFGKDGAAGGAGVGEEDGVSKDFVNQLQSTLQQVVKGMDGEGGGQLPGGAADEAGLQKLCAQLLQPELLSAPFRNLCGQYPQWLQDNAEKCSAEDLERYRQQHEILKEICAAYDEADEARKAETSAAPAVADSADTAAASADAAAVRAAGDATVEEVKEEPVVPAAFGGPAESNPAVEAATERIVKLVERLQALGQPPAELVESPESAAAGLPEDVRKALEQLQNGDGAGGGLPGLPGLPGGAGAPDDAQMKELLEAVSALQRAEAGGAEGDVSDLSKVVEALKKLGPEGDMVSAAIQQAKADVETEAAAAQNTSVPPAPPPRHSDPASLPGGVAPQL